MHRLQALVAKDEDNFRKKRISIRKLSKRSAHRALRAFDRDDIPKNLRRVKLEKAQRLAEKIGVELSQDVVELVRSQEDPAALEIMVS